MQFPTGDGGTIMVEVDRDEVRTPVGGVAKAGLTERAGEAMAVAQSTFESAVRDTVRRNAAAVTEAIKGLVERPSEIEVTFGLKATGEVGNFAIAKMSGEANLSLKLTWKHTASAPPAQAPGS
jgi:hypothetical protein